MPGHKLRRFALPALVLLFGVPLAACNGDDGEEEQEPAVAMIELTLGATTIVIDVFGTVTGGDFTIPAGNTAVTARFLRANGTVEPLVTDDEFELRIEGLNAAIATYTQGGAFNGTLTGLEAGQTSIDLILWHLVEMHDDFSLTTTLTVQ